MFKFMDLPKLNEANENGADGGGGSAPSIEELQAQLADATSQMAAMKAKNDELLTETKAAKTARREAEAAAEAERERIAREKGDYEQLHKSLEDKYNGLKNEYEGLQTSIAVEKKNTAALKIATELADGSNAELLGEFIGRRLKFTDDGLKVTDTTGALTVSSLDDLKKEFASDPRYAALLKGNQSSGGGANGGSNGGGAAQTMSRSDFDKLDPVAKSKTMKDGVTLTDD